MSIPSELGHLEVPINFITSGKKRLDQASLEPETARPRLIRSAVAPHWLG